MITIYKYALGTAYEQTVLVPTGARWLGVSEQFGGLAAWAVVDTSSPPTTHRFRVIGTGNDAEEVRDWKFLGSVQQYGGQLVWHVFVRESPG
jgi:hypothetical protein